MESVLSIGTSKLPSPPGEILNDRFATALRGGSEEPQPASPFTLRVKPDRRQEQLPIPAGLDRRRRSV